jgi:hypothetical protein
MESTTMIPIRNEKVWLFVIDTENYAGNFERPLCAYVTGVVGECGVGEDETEIFNKEMAVNEYAYDEGKHPFQFVIMLPDEHGCRRPVTIFPTPGFFNDGMGGIYKTGEEERALREYREKCHLEAERLYKGSKEFWEEKAKSRTLTKHPAYLSVAIFMNREPKDGEVAIMIDRSKKFIGYWADQEQIVIIGCRLLCNEQKITPVWSKKIVTGRVRKI